MRLIDADALKKALRDCQIESLIAHTEHKNLFDVINEQPTAYDVDAVVEELEKHMEDFDAKVTDYSEGVYDGLEDAIEVVKAGGKV